MNATIYNDTFFDNQVEGSLRSARAVVPVVMELTGARSVIDFGCGMGTWLRAFLENGVDQIIGLDGPYVDKDRAQVDRSCIVHCDLAVPIVRDRRYDLAICLEVAEHLPTRASRDLVNSLVAAAPVVLFSSAVPGQGGTAHCNEQWPEFWERLFSRAGMTRLDVVRPRIQQDLSIDWWYRQNLYLFAADPARIAFEQTNHPSDLELISPDVLDGYKSFGSLCRQTARAALRGLKNRIAERGWESGT